MGLCEQLYDRKPMRWETHDDKYHFTRNQSEIIRTFDELIRFDMEELIDAFSE